MSNPRNPDRLIASFLEDGPAELPDRSYDAVRAEIDHKRQWVVIGPWREQQMSRFAMFAAAAAVIVLVALVGLRFLPSTSGDGVGGQPTASPTSRPSPSASTSPTPIPT